MTDRTPEMMAAIYTRLDGDATLQGLLGGTGRVFNGVLAQQDSPYIDIGETLANDYHSSSGDAQEHTLTIHVWTEQPPGTGTVSARLQNLQIMGRVRDLLHYQNLSLSAGNMPNLRCEFTETMRDPDPGGLYWHGVLRFRIVTEG